MSDGIWYKGKYLGSVHYFTYREGKLPGRKEDIHVMMHDFSALEKLLSLSPQSKLHVGGEKKEDEIRYGRFRRETLAKTRHITLERNANNVFNIKATV